MQDFVTPKKSFGQHFLKDKNIAVKIVNSLTGYDNYADVIEVGPGMGVLSDIILSEEKFNWYGVEIDKESISYLLQRYPTKSSNIIEADFLALNFKQLSGLEKFAIIGNFPYNISTQIVFKVIENRNIVPEMVGMFQKEVAQRICSEPGSKVYGILSVLTQAYYNVEYLFQVNENVFNPPPKVKSAVIRLQRKSQHSLPCDEKLFFSVVKSAFNQRRKTIRNSLKGININWEALPEGLHGERPEQLGFETFFLITNAVIR
ncbi:MAG: 16S rRNA (adenine(1518)-N(6)/adenine(1519)-N(6))-dimethyltransferase RsmA [Bacteroidetes bacterium]|nr:16S rRNA (adenine(1518)-N(6)/adenine(1519)-N(6))-dimethyltransferase RsmA [Bacteroidota bacterium]